ncbi:MAG: CRTAC1 family protein, partial [Flavobacteriales bacterium]|nr:CRTAC1 family protein [Flavobacteriales bacterium]
MVRRINAILVVLLLLTSIPGAAQGYEDITEASGVSAYCSGLWGAGATVFDFNADGWDDITLPSGNSVPVFYQNNGDLTFTEVDFGISYIWESKCVLWADYDNDGDYDLFINGYGGCGLYNNDNGTFTNVTNAAGITHFGATGTGASFADINGDGWLDLYVCNYNFSPNTHTNYLYMSDGDGTFTNMTTEYGVGDGYSPTFQSTFFDMDRDGDQDLFLITDRDNYFNKIYRNDNGTFSEVGTQVNLHYDMWAMTNTIDDFNNDGMPDIYITNGLEGNRMFINDLNNSGQFIDVTDDYNVAINGFCWGSGFTDYDNDGWKDLWVCSEPYLTFDGEHWFFRNETNGFSLDIGAGVFSSEGRTFGYSQGDFDGDGFEDVLTNSMAPLNTEVWRNEATGGHSIQFLLNGTISNPDGIGSYIDVYFDDQQRTALTFCGENYLGQNSRRETLGTGEATVVDSVVVTWPSGHVDVWHNMSTDSVYTLEEGSSLVANILASAEWGCTGDTLTLYAEGDWESYSWSTGDTTNYITVTGSQITNLVVTTSLGLTASASLNVIFNDPITPVATWSDPTCFDIADGQITINEPPLDSILWTDGNTDFTRVDLMGGWYTYTTIDTLGCSLTDSLLLTTPDSISVWYLTSPVSCFGGNDGAVVLDSLWGAVEPYEVNTSNDLSAGDHLITLTDAQGCTSDQWITIESPDELIATGTIAEGTTAGTQSITLDISGGTPPYDTQWSTGSNQTTAIDNLLPGEY